MLVSLFNKVTDQGLQLYQRETPTQVCSCEYWEVFKNTYFQVHLQRAASGYGLYKLSGRETNMEKFKEVKYVSKKVILSKK